MLLLRTVLSLNKEHKYIGKELAFSTQKIRLTPLRKKKKYNREAYHLKVLHCNL